MIVPDIFEMLLEQLKREPPEEQERHRKLFHDAFMKMAEPDYQLESRLNERTKAWLQKRFGPSEPLPPLQPGRARIVSFD